MVLHVPGAWASSSSSGTSPSSHETRSPTQRVSDRKATSVSDELTGF